MGTRTAIINLAVTAIASSARLGRCPLLGIFFAPAALRNMGRLAQLSLFRQVLRMHQRKLPQLARDLGDRYVRQEFRAIGSADKQPTVDQETAFMAEWRDYISHLAIEADLLGVGRDLSDDVVESLSDEQRLQLQKLHDHTKSMGKTGK